MVNSALKIASASAFALVLFMGANPAQAQENAGDKVRVLDLYGEDEACPQSTEQEIVVCRRFDEEERYRIPETLRDDPNSIKNEAWTERVRSLEVVGRSGTDSCSPVGAGGFTGCTQQLVRQAYAERESNSDAQAGVLIQAAREERLSRIDEEAAAVEEREQQVAAQMEARRLEREAAEAAETGETPSEDLTQPPF